MESANRLYIEDLPFKDKYRIVKSSFQGTLEKDPELIPHHESDLDFYDESAFSFKEAIAAIGNFATGAGNAIGGVVTGGIGIATAAAPGLAPILPQLGIGSKSRIKEINAQAAANERLLTLQMENLKLSENAAGDRRQLLVIGGAMLLVVSVLALTLRS